MLKRQAEWQRARKALSWPEKVDLSLKLREAAKKLRASQRKSPREE
jgi:hypothetical protein